MGVEQTQWPCRISIILLVDSQEVNLYKPYVFRSIIAVIACFENNTGSLSLGNSFQILCRSLYSKITNKTIIEVSRVYSIKSEKTDFKTLAEEQAGKNSKKLFFIFSLITLI